MFPNGARPERVVVAGKHVCRNAHERYRIDDALDVGAIDAVVFEDVAGQEKRIALMRADEVGQRTGARDALVAHGFSAAS
jgi:hypothetical protein